MNKEKIIEGLNETINGLTKLRDAMTGDTPETAAAPASPKKEKTTSPAPAAPMTGKFDTDQLNAMPYNEFKKLAAQLGVSCKGTRDDIMKRVMALDVTIDQNGEATVEDPAEEDTTPAPTTKKVSKKTAAAEKSADEQVDNPKSDKLSGGKRGLVKKAVEPTPDEFDLKAKAIAENTPVEDIISALSEVGVKASKKDYLTKLATALREGNLEVDDDEEDEDAPDETTAAAEPEGESDEDEISSKSYFPEYDPEGFNDPENMSDERQEAIATKMDEVLTAYSEGELSPQDVETYLTENATQEELDLLGDDPSEDDMLKAYMELVKRTIDNDGEEHTEKGDPYEVGSDDMCCGHKLKFIKKSNKYVCEMCGTEFEAE